MTSLWIGIFVTAAACNAPAVALRSQGEDGQTALDLDPAPRAQAESICGPGMEVILAGEEAEQKCHCECPASGCAKLSCAADYMLEGEHCVKYEQVFHAAIPAKEEPLVCPKGSTHVGIGGAGSGRAPAQGSGGVATPGGAGWAGRTHLRGGPAGSSGTPPGAVQPGGVAGFPGGVAGGSGGSAPGAGLPGGAAGLPGGVAAGSGGSAPGAGLPGGAAGLPGGISGTVGGAAPGGISGAVGGAAPGGAFGAGSGLSGGGAGDLEGDGVADGTITCIDNCGCDINSIGAHGLHSNHCDCAYEVGCPEAMRLLLEGAEPVCVADGIPERTEVSTSHAKLIRECPESFRELENSDECVKDVEVVVPATPARRERLACPSGELEEHCNGRILCFSEGPCPKVDSMPGTQVSSCGLSLEISCEDPMELSVQGKEYWCIFNGTPSSTKMEQERAAVIERCPEDFTRSGNGCVRNETTVIPAVPEKRESLLCPMGQWIGQGDVGSLMEIGQEGAAAIGSTEVAAPTSSQAEADLTCLVNCECPSSLASTSGAKIKGCKCMQHFACDEPMKAVREDSGELVCKAEGAEARQEEVRKEAEPTTVCPGESTHDAAAKACIKPLEQCPEVVDVQLDAKALACGPHTLPYIDHMFNQIHDFNAIALKQVHVRKQSLFDACSVSCISIYTKFSECAEQDDAGVCAGRAGRSGKAVRPIGELSDHDDCSSKPYDDLPWLRNTSACQGGWLKHVSNKFLPCKDMYGSEFNFQSNWAEAVSEVEEIAAANFIRLSGEYVEKPFGHLHCREAYCQKVDTQGKDVGSHSLGACLQGCVKSWS